MQVNASVSESDIGGVARRAGRRPSPSTPIPAAAVPRRACRRCATRRSPCRTSSPTTSLVAVDNPDLRLEARHDGQRHDHHGDARRRAARAAARAALRPRRASAAPTPTPARAPSRRRADRVWRAGRRRQRSQRVAVATGIATSASPRSTQRRSAKAGDAVVVAVAPCGRGADRRRPSIRCMPRMRLGRRRCETARASRSATSGRSTTLGDVAVEALRGVSLVDRRAASSSPSWAPRARASRR